MSLLSVNPNPVALRVQRQSQAIATRMSAQLEPAAANLRRIRELGVRSAHITPSSSDRAALQVGVAQLFREITRGGNQASFIDAVDQARASLGAAMNRFEAEIVSERIGAESLTASQMPSRRTY